MNQIWRILNFIFSSFQCTQFVDKYSDMIIDMITHDLSPDEVQSLM